MTMTMMDDDDDDDGDDDDDDDDCYLGYKLRYTHFKFRGRDLRFSTSGLFRLVTE